MQNRDARFARQRALPGFGDSAQEALAAARVLVIGAGGLGSATIPALAAAGVGTVGIIDVDVVEPSNLHRQLIHSPADVGRSKVASAAESVAEISPETVVHAYEGRLDSGNAIALFSQYDLVLDGSDNFPTRYLASDAATITGIPLVWGAVSQYGGQASACRTPETPGYRDLFPVPPPPGAVPTCAEGGVLPTVCAVVGSIMATEAIKIITGLGRPLFGRVTSYDARTGAFRELEFAKDPDATPVTNLIDYDAFCGIPPARSDDINGRELAGVLGRVQLLDVREGWEAEIATIPGAIVVPLGALGHVLDRLAEGTLEGLDPQRPTVVYCHLGVRSAHAMRMLKAAGFEDVRHLDGGIDAYARDVDPALSRY